MLRWVFEGLGGRGAEEEMRRLPRSKVGGWAEEMEMGSGSGEVSFICMSVESVMVLIVDWILW